ncbi:sensor histidine kinase [Fodinibius salsisoli]|uniref:histidine kinase n=1 Tax=Fodinibius salsisoli TaxID=2820877 RepID=A0ABT3PNV9_9BACT|nr:HAMP domain-containing sensor histidine kinase [Fodinibius salsisoli]MCW9707540.1 HAMP domain-containing protein [Fodinibius salsisoli]
MKKLFTSFYGKLSMVFLLLLIALGIAQVLITYNSSMQFVRQADQKLNLDLAKNMAAEFEPHLKDSLALEEIKHSIHDMMVVNPRIEIYILNGAGKILAYFVGPGKEINTESVDLEPVEDFLNQSYENLIFGEDPRNPERQKPFSAAPISMGATGSGYIYIILGGEQYDSALSMLENSYFLQTSMKVFTVILLVTGIVGLILFAFLTKRLRGMTETIEGFDREHLNRRVEVQSNDEIGRLGKSFNRMADTIQNNVKELEKTDRLRRELIANVSHDLRSPLASIQGYVETILLKEPSLDPAKREKYLNIILQNTTMLRQLVEELFELSKLDTKQVDPQLEPFSIADLLQDVSLKFEQQAEQKGITLKAQAPNSLPIVEGDISLIERVLSNLIENAIQYTPEGGRIEVRLHPDHEQVGIAVVDNGPGITEEDLPHIFDRFYRAEKSRSKKEGGTGLGLAIAKKILELHGQQIFVKNREEAGTIFYFYLPIGGNE